MILTVVFSLLFVNEVETLRFELAVDEGTSETSPNSSSSQYAGPNNFRIAYVQDLLRLSVASGLAVGSNVLLVGTSRLESRGTRD